MKVFVAAVVLMLSGASTGIAGGPWGEVRFSYGSYGMTSSEPPADGGEIYLGDNQGPTWEGRLGYAGASRWSPGLAVTRYSAGREGQSSSWAWSALIAYSSREPEHLVAFGVDLALGFIRADFDRLQGRVRGEGPNIALAFALEPQVRTLSIPFFVGVRYAAMRNARREGPTFRSEGVLDYSGVFFGIGARLGGAGRGSGRMTENLKEETE